MEASPRPNYFDDPEPTKFERCNRYTWRPTASDEWEIVTYNDAPHKLARQYLSESLKIGMLKLRISRIVQALLCDFKYGAEFEETVEAGAASKVSKEFNERADRWQRHTAAQSSPTKKFMHEDYQIIMTMGEAVIPLILKRLQSEPDEWFWALKHLAKGEDAAIGQDNFDDALKAWLHWGRQKGYIA